MIRSRLRSLERQLGAGPPLALPLATLRGLTTEEIRWLLEARFGRGIPPDAPPWLAPFLSRVGLPPADVLRLTGFPPGWKLPAAPAPPPVHVNAAGGALPPLLPVCHDHDPQG